MFEIKLTDVDVTSGSVPITWCVDSELLNTLAELKIADPQVVIITSPKNYFSSKEHRFVVPLKDMMAYVSFQSPGDYFIRAFVSAHNKRDTINKYLESSFMPYYNYNKDVLVQTGDAFSSMIHRELSSSAIQVLVPEECFAPPPFDEKFVNWLFHNKPKDQCSFRRRRLFAYTIGILAFLLKTFLNILLLFVALLLGLRSITLKYIFHPIKYDFPGPILEGKSYFINHLPEDDSDKIFFFAEDLKVTISYLFRKLWKLPFMPLIAIPLLTAALFHPIGLLYVILGVVFVALIALSILNRFNFVNVLTDKFLSLFNKTFTNKLWYLDQKEMDLLLCERNKKALTYDSLPRKSFRLRYNNLKNKVCKPFAR